MGKHRSEIQRPEEPLILVLGNSFVELHNAKTQELELIKQTLTYNDQEIILQIQQYKKRMFFILQKAKAGRASKVEMGRVGFYRAEIAALETQIKKCWLLGKLFPSGHLSLVAEQLIMRNIVFEIKDTRIQPKKTEHFKWVTEPNSPRYYQEEMLNLAKTEHRGVFESAVGTGKTLVMQLIVKHFDTPTIIISPSKDLAAQTYDSFHELFGEVVQIPKLADIEQGTLAPIRIVTIQFLNSLKRAGLLKDALKGVGMICIDEIHHAGAKSYTDLLGDFDAIYYRFGFSGTFLRNDSKTLDMWGFLSTVLYRYGADRATQEGFLTPMKVKVHEIKGKKQNQYAAEYTANYCDNPLFLSGIRKVIEENTLDGEQILILVKQKDKAGKIISAYLTELGIENVFISGDDKKDVVKFNINAFNNKSIPVLIGSTIIGEGIDIRSTDHLIMAQGGKSEIAITQAVGRAVRLFPGKKVAVVHDFEFKKTKYLTDHLKERTSIYFSNFAGELI